MKRDDFFLVVVLVFYMFVILSIGGALLSGCGKLDARDGANGAPCTASSDALGTYITCPDGTSTFIANGTNGVDGVNGVDGTQVTIVTLCEGVTIYPYVFVEIAYCIDGKLYGTYSANGGFSTEIVPGAYSSNGINSSCSFTVGPNCEVTH